MINTAEGDKRCIEIQTQPLRYIQNIHISLLYHFDQGMADLSAFPITTATTVLLRSIKDLEDLKKSEEQEWKREYWFQEDNALIKRQ